LNALDGIASASSSTREDLLKRLVAEVSGLTLAETEEVLGELERLHRRYPPEEVDDR
jgi:hypothetical protein